jgi:predicted Zn-dependent protease
MKRFAIGTMVAIAALGAIQSAHADPFKPGKGDQVKLGQQASDQVKKQEKIVPANDPRVKKLREIGNRLMAAEPLKKDEPWKFSFDLIQNKEANAFALPGGPIYFYTGLFDRFLTEDQIAGVLAHEITHIRKEHWAYAYRDQQKRDLLLFGILLGTNANRTTADLLSIGSELVFGLPYSRRHETESDDIGLAMMIKAGYNPQGIVDAFKVLETMTKNASKPPEWISTHPDTSKRIKALETKVKALKGPFNPQIPVPWAKKS